MKILRKDGTFHVELFDAEGKRHVVPTGETDRKAAEEVAKRAKVAELEMVNKAMRLTGEAVTRLVCGRRVSLGQARDEWNTWMNDTGHLSAQTQDMRIRDVGRWLTASGLTDRTPADVTPRHVNVWVNRERGGKANTRKTMLSSLRSFLAWCSDRGYLIGNPAKLCKVNTRAISHEQRETVHTRAFTEAEADLILASVEGFWRSASVLSRETGLRLSDICRLERSCLSGKELTVWTIKTTSRVRIKLSSPCIDELNSVPFADAKYFFPKERAIIEDPRRRASLTMRYSRMLSKLGIRGAGFHSWRAYAAKRRTATDGLEAARKQLGHKHAGTTATYAGD